MATPVDVYDVTISAGVLDVSAGSGIYNVATEGGAATDEITEIIGAAHPHVYELRVAVAGQYWTIQHNPAGNIFLEYGFGFATANPRDRIVLRASETGNDAEELFRKIIPET